MKIRIETEGFRFSPDYHTKLLGVIHKWIGPNQVHDGMSLYSWSWIRNNGFFFTCWDNQIGEMLLEGVRKKPEMWPGVKAVKAFNLRINDDAPLRMGSPVLVKRNGIHHMPGTEASLICENILKRKAEIAQIDLHDFQIVFGQIHKTKLIRIHDINNRCFFSDIEIRGSRIASKFARRVGLGNSTGCGFGMIY